MSNKQFTQLEEQLSARWAKLTSTQDLSINTSQELNITHHSHFNVVMCHAVRA